MVSTFSCDDCLRTFPSSLLLKTHVEGHNARFRCEDCDINITDKESFGMHSKTVHRGNFANFLSNYYFIYSIYTFRFAANEVQRLQVWLDDSSQFGKSQE